MKSQPSLKRTTRNFLVIVPSFQGRVIATVLLIVAPSFNSVSEYASAEEAAAIVSKTIQRLGSKSFIEREDACEQLLFLGANAESALLSSSSSPDQEIRDRSKRLLKLIQEQKRTKLLADFRASRDTAREAANNDNADEARSTSAELPGWRRFAERYGDTLQSRELYIKMMEAEWELIESCFREQDEFLTRNHLMSRYREMLQRGLNYHTSSMGTACSLFYLYSEFPDAAGPGLQTLMFNYLRNPHVNQTLSGRQKNSLVRELVSDWVIAASGRQMNDRNAQAALQNARFFDLEKASRFVAEQILKDKESLPMMKRNAMESIVVRGDVSQLDLIESFLEDRTVLGVSNQRTRQLRDVALASAMQLQGFDVRKIGVRLAQSRTAAFDFQSLGFITEGDREKAFEQYGKLQAAKAQSQ